MYYFSGTSKKYIDAQQFCARVNAYLVEFYDLVQYTERTTRTLDRACAEVVKCSSHMPRRQGSAIASPLMKEGLYLR